LRDVDVGEIAHTRHLNILWCPDEVDALKSSIWDDTSTTVGFGAECYCHLLCIADRREISYNDN